MMRQFVALLLVAVVLAVMFDALGLVGLLAGALTGVLVALALVALERRRNSA
jgi:hypothetical protein